jgi:hypothetical protein
MKPGTDSREASPLAARVDGKSDCRTSPVSAGEASEIARVYLFWMQEGFGTSQIFVVDRGTPSV